MQIVRPATNPNPYLSVYAHVARLPWESYHHIHIWTTQEAGHHGPKKGKKGGSGTKEVGVSQVLPRREEVGTWCRLM